LSLFSHGLKGTITAMFEGPNWRLEMGE
jgi:hypothetical protein